VANLVPAAAVIRGPLVFDLMTRCKWPQRRLSKFLIKYYDSIVGLSLKREISTRICKGFLILLM